MAAEKIARIVAEEIKARPDQVDAALKLLDEGATVPFVARYRKEATGGLDDGQLRTLAERVAYLRELEARRTTIVESINSQGKMTDELSGKIATVTTKSELEGLTTSRKALLLAMPVRVYLFRRVYSCLLFVILRLPL